MTTLPPIKHAKRHAIQYRSLCEDDMDFLCRLYRSTREGELAIVPWSDEEKQTFIEMQFNAQHAHYQKHYPDALWLLVEQAGQPIGRLYLEEWDGEHRIIDIALLTGLRGKGIGADILCDIQDAAASGGKRVGIHVEKENPAMSLYRRLGFISVEDKGVYDLMIWEHDR